MKKPSCQITIRNFYNNMTMDIDFLRTIEGAKHIVKSRLEKEEVFEAFVFKVCAN